MRVRSLLVTVCALALLAPAGARADFFQTFSGSNVGQPMFDRPNGSCSATGTTVRYQAQTFFLPDAADCYIVSAQSYDGYIHLYEGGFNPASPTTNCLEGDDDGELGIGTSRIPFDQSDNAIALTSGLYTLVTSAFSGGGTGSFQNTIHCDAAQPTPGGCFFTATPRERQTCHFDRFAVRIINITNHPGSGVGTPVRFGSTDSSIFWFYNDRNFEVMLKVLNACSINGHYWVFIGALTNQGYTIQVGDAQTQQINEYSNTLGTRAPAVADIQAFPCN